jgi:ABC-type dipeptide/oligopeptide/nickel transport system permease component
MHKYVLRRLLLAVPVLVLSSLIVFGLMRVMPGDALTVLMGESGNVGDKELAKLRRDLGLDRPYHEQYAIWLWQMVTLNPGDSIFTNEPIPVSLRKAIPVTLELAALAMIIGIVIAVPVGVLSATRQDSPSDYVGRVVAVSGLSLPDFWLATLVITFAAIWFQWIPPIGYVTSSPIIGPMSPAPTSTHHGIATYLVSTIATSHCPGEVCTATVTSWTSGDGGGEPSQVSIGGPCTVQTSPMPPLASGAVSCGSARQPPPSIPSIPSIPSFHRRFMHRSWTEVR